jgi:hypothetical protein
MINQELNTIIEKLKANNPKEDAIFGMHIYGGSTDESYIKANKEGLKRYAAELLAASIELESLKGNTEKKVIPFHTIEDWVDEMSDTYIQYIEPVFEKKNSVSEELKKATIKEKLLGGITGFVIISVLLFILFLIINGFRHLVS